MQKPQVVFVLGGPGAGKGTQCDRIVRDYGFVHLSAGDLLRAERQKGGEVGELIENYIREGKIVPVEITVNLIKDQIMANVANGKMNFLVDGFPRNEDNLQGWRRVMQDYCEVAFVLYLDCDECHMEARVLSRGGGRSDDNIDVLKKRFRTYVESTQPIIDLFASQGLVRKVDARDSVDAVYANIQKIFDPVFGRPVPASE